MQKKIFTASEASRLLNQPLGRVLRQLKRSNRPLVRLGRSIVILPDELLRLQRELQHPSDPGATRAPKTAGASRTTIC